MLARFACIPSAWSRFQRAAQAESLAESARAMLGVPLALALVGGMSSLALSVWHGFASYGDVRPTAVSSVGRKLPLVVTAPIAA